jgi:hypothetical protein
MANNILAGMQYVQQQGDIGRERKNNRLLGDFASQALSGTPDQRDWAVAESAKISPDAAYKLQGQTNDQEDRRQRTIYNMAKGLKPLMDASPERAAQYYETQLAPGLERMGIPVDKKFDRAAIAPVLEQVITMYESAAQGGKGGVQSVRIGEDGYYYNVMRDGRVVNTGIKANPNIRVLEQEGQLPYGVVTSGGVAGSVVPLGGGGPARQAQAGAAPAGGPESGGGHPSQEVVLSAANMMSQAGLPPEKIEAWIQQQMSQPTSIGAPEPVATAAQQPAPVPAGGPVRIPTAAETAREVQDAKNASDLAAYEQGTANVVRREGLVSGARESAKNQADKAAMRPKAQLALRQASTRLGRVEEVAASIQPRIGAWTAGLLGSAAAKIAGTPAHDLAADLSTLEAIAGFDELAAMRAASPTGGALGNVTERELALLQASVSAMKNSQSPDQLRRNIERFVRDTKIAWERIQEAFDEDFGQGGGPAAPAAGADGGIDDLLGKYGAR